MSLLNYLTMKEYGDTSTYNVIVFHFPLQNLINKRIPLIVKSSA